LERANQSCFESRPTERAWSPTFGIGWASEEEEEEDINILVALHVCKNTRAGRQDYGVQVRVVLTRDPEPFFLTATNADSRGTFFRFCSPLSVYEPRNPLCTYTCGTQLSDAWRRSEKRTSPIRSVLTETRSNKPLGMMFSNFVTLLPLPTSVNQKKHGPTHSYTGLENDLDFHFYGPCRGEEQKQNGLLSIEHIICPNSRRNEYVK